MWAQYDKYCAGSSQAGTENMDRGGEWAHWYLTEQVLTHINILLEFNKLFCTLWFSCVMFCCCFVLQAFWFDNWARSSFKDLFFFLSFVCFYVLKVKAFSGLASVKLWLCFVNDSLLFTDENISCFVLQSSFGQWWCIIRASENCSSGQKGYNFPKSLLQARGSVQVRRLGHCQYRKRQPWCLKTYKYNKCSHEYVSHGILLNTTWRSALYTIHLLNKISMSLTMTSRVL